MMQPFRTTSGGRVDRNTAIRFTFDGKVLTGLKGDTLASALLANGIHLVGRSFKYHRPRGILTAGPEEPNALVGIRRDEARYTPNQRATVVELYERLAAESQNRWPSLGFDAGAVNDLAAPLFPAGFYYKTFMWPASFWKRVYEPVIRQAAGLGRAPSEGDADRYGGGYKHCDVLVIGGGPAGIAAALAAAETGADVILCDEQNEFGGSLLSDASASIGGVQASQWLGSALGELFANPRVTVLPRTTAFAYFTANMVALLERVTDHLPDPDERLPRERLWQVRAKEVVIAAGAIERPLVFPGNDRPGIMLAHAARSYVNRYGVKPGSRAVVFTACDSAYRAALDMQAAGIEIATIADLRPAPGPPWAERAKAAGIPLTASATIIGTFGRKRVNGVQLGFVEGQEVHEASVIRCDLVAMSGGWTPSLHLFSQSRGKVVWDEKSQSFLPGVSVQRERSAGACRGIYGLGEALADGFEAGRMAAQSAGFTPPAVRPFAVEGVDKITGSFAGLCPKSTMAKGKAFVDFQNDVASSDIELAVREGFRSIEHVKRYTTAGMATDQGKTSNVNALAIAAEARGTHVPSVGLTTFRMPYTPVTFGALAGVSRGEQFEPVRTTPIHEWAEENGAVFENVGAWKRAHYFPKRGETMREAVARECTAVRNAVGIVDASTLGKIEVCGPDAGNFLNRLYPGNWDKLKMGAARYALMLRDDGYIFDDGIIARLSEDRYHVTTTTGGAARVLAHMEDYLQTEWPNLEAWITPITEQWAVIPVQGPKARDVIAPLVEGIDLGSAAFPHNQVREGAIAGIDTRLFRVSFTGELGFEINVPSDYGRYVWEVVWAEAQKYGGVAYGTETLHVLRAEKGYIIIGQETDGSVTPDDVGLSWVLPKHNRDFVGRRGLLRPDLAAAGRRQLVGIITDDPSEVLEEGAQVIDTRDPPRGTPALGHVTSSYWSSTLGRSIALALVSNGRARIGSGCFVTGLHGSHPAKIVSHVFYDPKGQRLHG